MELTENKEQELDQLFDQSYDEAVLRRIEFWKAIHYFRNYLRTKAAESKALKQEIKDTFKSGDIDRGSCLMFKRHILRKRITEHHEWYRILRANGAGSLPDSIRKQIADYDPQNVRSGKE